jgi:DNA-binding HxlR family transcriptional regulator
MLNRDYPDQVCSIARALEIVGERWSLLILRDAVQGRERFEDFQHSLGIASNVLSARLKHLCDEGVLDRVPDEQRPGRPRYVLTAKGRELAARADRDDEMGRSPLPDARRPPDAHPPRRLRRHHGAGLPLR